MSKKVSIILATHNGENYIRESIDSVLNQNFKNFEFIIINDASGDNTFKILKNYAEQDSRITLIHNENNIWLTSSLNKWISLSTWEYIARIDDDDIWDKEKLSKQVIFMDENKMFGLYWTAVEIIDSLWTLINHHKNRNKNEDIKSHLLQSNQFTHSSVIIRKDVLNTIGLYNPQYNGAEDYELWLRIWKDYLLWNSEEILTSYRFHNESISRKRWFKQEILWLKIARKYRKYYARGHISLIYRCFFLVLPKKIQWKIIEKLSK